MKPVAILLFAGLACTSAFAAKPCDELKSEIAAKLDAAGVKHYTLEIVESDKVGEARVVGSCNGGTKKITYARK